MKKSNIPKVREFIDALGLTEEPMCMFYTNEEPVDGISPKPGARCQQRKTRLPSV